MIAGASSTTKFMKSQFLMETTELFAVIKTEAGMSSASI